MPLFRFVDGSAPPTVRAGWRRPSWPGLIVVATMGAVAGLLPISGFLLVILPLPLVVAAFVGFLYACVRQHAIEGSLLVAAALAIGQFASACFAQIGRQSSEHAWWVRPVGLAAVFFLLGLAVAPVVIAQSQRRVR